MATLVAGLFSLMTWEIPAGTDRVGVVRALASAGASSFTATGGLYRLEHIPNQMLRAVVKSCLTL